MQIESNQTTKRKTPTQRQVEALAHLDQEQLIEKALQALHALNRRAKSKRDQRNEYRRSRFAKALDHQIDEIYALKDRFLDALLLSGRGKVFTFEVEGYEVYCQVCDRSWYGDDWCYRCETEGERVPEDWYLVEAGSYRFHQPDVSEEAAALATQIATHDPQQPAREIPSVTIEVQASRGKMKAAKLTVEAQMACVRMAIASIAPGGSSTAYSELAAE